MMMMFIGTESLVTQLVYESSRMQANRTTREIGGVGSSSYWRSILVTFSDWLRLLAHIDTGNRKIDARGNRTHNLKVWSRTWTKTFIVPFITTQTPGIHFSQNIFLTYHILTRLCSPKGKAQTA